MRSWLILPLLVSALSASAASHAADAPPPAAARLVKVMAADQSAWFGMLRSFEKLHADGKLSDAKLACLNGLDGSVMAAPLARLIGTLLTGSEIASSLEFFDSPTGKRVLQAAEARRYESVGLPSPVGKIDLDAGEIDQLRQFMASPASKLLLNPDAMMQAPGARDTAQEILRIVNSCKEAPASRDKAADPRRAAGAALDEAQLKLRLVERWLHAVGFGEAFQGGIKKILDSEHKTTPFLDSVLAAPSERIDSLVAPIFAKGLTSAEARIVAEFYESPTGRIMNTQIAREVAGAPRTPFSLSDEQKAEFMKYAATPAAIKARDLMRDASVRDEYVTVLRTAFSK